MSDFLPSESLKKPHIDAFVCALVSQEPCKFEVNATCGQLIDLVFFLRLAVAKGICSDKETVENVEILADTISALITQNFPSFVDFNWDDPAMYFEAVQESNWKYIDPELMAIFDSLFKKFQQVADAVNSSDAADE